MLAQKARSSVSRHFGETSMSIKVATGARGRIKHTEQEMCQKSSQSSSHTYT